MCLQRASHHPGSGPTIRPRQTNTNHDQTCFALHVHGLPCSRLSTSSGLCRLSNRQPPQAAINATCCSVPPLPSRHSETPPVIPSHPISIMLSLVLVQKGSTDAHTASGGNGTGSANPGKPSSSLGPE
ncbi:uncharacterized protein TrAtP1_003666 [Trichoderma atroviride]|uniref:uncharacterized protein n=1 Tax=Hypocrea atroviridis TaxID=63577 RepID=UPI00331952FB|nr:hypothetical protein TrAtP1_003666 [Trichoderma atroviride]